MKNKVMVMVGTVHQKMPLNSKHKLTNRDTTRQDDTGMLLTVRLHCLERRT